MPSSVMNGNFSCASLGEMSAISKPKPRAVVAARFISDQRSADDARRTLPTSCQSIAWPVSRSSVR